MKREPKKTDFIEVRVATETKTAFMHACQEHGASASSVLRSSIHRYIDSAGRASWKKELEMLFTSSSLRRRAVAAAMSALAAGAAVISLAGPARAAVDPRLQAVFAWMDQNHDHRLSPVEFLSSPERASPAKAGNSVPDAVDLIVDTKAPPQAGETREALFRRIDANHGGSLDLKEFAASASVKTVFRPEIADADRDGDGELSEGELAAFLTALQARNGIADPAEGAGIMAHGIIAERDRDRDGKVALADLQR